MKLSGVLEFSMGGFLCLRGFADYRLLAKSSIENPDVQRSLINEHKGEMAEFLNKGEYLFFPEVILSVSLLSGNNYEDVNRFFEIVRMNGFWNEKLGDINISIFNHTSGDKNRIAHISFDENTLKLNRIDGNHRLSAADSVSKEIKIPFCLILCRNPREEDQYSRAIFHNVNAKQIPLKLEQNLKVILCSPEVFSDDKLKKDPSFGWPYYLARKTMERMDFAYFRTINSYISGSTYTFFVDLYTFLLNDGKIEKDDDAIDIVKSQLFDIERALVDSKITATTTNIAVIGALAYYRLTDEFKYRGFLSWVKRNHIGNVNRLHIADVIQLYDKIAEHVPKKAFLARWYPSPERDGKEEADRAQCRVLAMKELAEELSLELIDLGTCITGSFDIRKKIYNNIRECDIFIADVSGARHNVMLEIGYALKHVDTGRMVFYFQKSDKCAEVPFDVSHLAYDEIVDSGEIKTKTKARIKKILEQTQNGEI